MLKITKKVNIGIILIIILTIQVMLSIFFGYQKSGFHEDEIAMFRFCSIPEQYVRNIDGYYDSWKTGDFYHNTIIPSEENRFNYGLIAEPNPYYYILHTILSIFPDMELKWLGIIPNIFFNCLTTILLFLLVKQIYDTKLGITTVFGWSISIGSMTLAVFTRNYAMYTMIVVLLFFLHIFVANKAINKIPISNILFAAIAFCTVLGITTQYYFAILLFLVGLCFTVFLYFAKLWNILRKYIFTQLLSVICALLFLINSDVFAELSSQSRSTASIANLSLKKIVLSIDFISEDIWNGCLIPFSIIAILFYIFVFVNRYWLQLSLKHESNVGIWIVKRKPLSNSSLLIPYHVIYLLLMASVVFTYIIIVTGIAIWHSDRYFLCIEPIVFFLIVAVLLDILKRALRNTRIALVFSLVCIIGMSCLAFMLQDVNYLYEDRKDRAQILEQYRDYPVVIMSVYPTKPEQFIYEYEDFNEIYRCRNNDPSGIQKAMLTKDLSKGFVLYTFNFSDPEDLFSNINDYSKLESVDLIIEDTDYPVYFCIPSINNFDISE